MLHMSHVALSDAPSQAARPFLVERTSTDAARRGNGRVISSGKRPFFKTGNNNTNHAILGRSESALNQPNNVKIAQAV